MVGRVLALVAAVAVSACVEVPERRRVTRTFAGPDAGVSDGELVALLGSADLPATRLVLALDCGPGMDEPLGDESAPSKRHATREAIETFLDRELGLEVALVLFDGSVRATIPASPGAPAEIREALAAHPRGDGRDWAAGLDAAAALAEGAPGARAVVLISDGAPEAPAPDPVGAAIAVARDAGASIFAVAVGEPDPDPFRRLAGEDRAASAPDPARLTRRIAREIPDILPCETGPIEAGSDAEALRVFLRAAGGAERPVPAVAEPADFPGDLGFAMDPATGRLRLTAATCAAVRGGGERLAVRVAP